MTITVVIPTYNGGERVVHLLGSLAERQSDVEDLELIVVDNASTDNTRDLILKAPCLVGIARRGWQFRLVAEPTPGANVARLRGLREAKSDLVCFLDDDVEPAERFFSSGMDLFKDGAVGGAVPRIRPRFEAPPPPSILRRQHLLAINFQFLPEHPVDWSGDEMPFAPTVTAGFIVRRNALMAAVDARGLHRMMPGRIGKALACGEDIELGVLLRRSGYTLRYSPALELTHNIPVGRFRTGYFSRLIVGIVRSEATLAQIYRPDLPRARAASRWFQMLFALLAIPAVLFRRDGWREVCFVIASRWAAVAGPYPELLNRVAQCEPKASDERNEEQTRG
jgi:glycosyltransferase involved in cell wall biosynthesis